MLNPTSILGPHSASILTIDDAYFILPFINLIFFISIKLIKYITPLK